MKIALVSAKFKNRDIKYNLSQMRRYMKEAKNNNASLVCFGETFLQGFDALNWNYSHDRHIAVDINSEEVKEICSLSEKIDIDVLFGFIEKEDDKLFSSCALIRKGKVFNLYRRISKGWKEYTITDEHYEEGKSVQVFKYEGKKCLITLCGDLWDFPDKFKLNEDILFWPIYVNFSINDWKEKYLKEYLIQANSVCKNVLLINSLSNNPDAFGGCYFFKNGIIKASLDYGNEGLLFVSL